MSTEQRTLQNATRLELLQATALNHQELFSMNATVVNGEVHTADGFNWTYAGPRHESMIAFPDMTPHNAGSTLD